MSSPPVSPASPAPPAPEDGRAASLSAPALPSGDPIIQLTYRDGKGIFHADWPVSRIQECLDDQAGILWVDIQGADEPPDRTLEEWLCQVFDFHPLAVEDALKESHVPKVDEWGDYLYIVFHVARIDEGSEVLVLEELDFFLGRNYLVTYHIGALPILDQDRVSIEHDPRDRLRHGADHLLYHFLELAIDESLKAIEKLDEQVDAIQNAVIEHASSKNLKTIFRIKRSAIQLHKSLSPQRELLNKLARDPFAAVKPKHRVYFRDLYDHVVRIHDISESLRDLIAGSLETYLSVVSNRTNDIMKTLTIVTVMFMPMSFLVGFFGMNFFADAIALKGPMPKGLLFWGSIAIMAISPCFIWVYARRKRWF
jgi:magnesium transporter